MVHYIRFLKPPKVREASSKSVVVFCVATITTDLGESFFPSNAILEARLVAAGQPSKTLTETSCKWHSGQRTASITLMSRHALPDLDLRVHLTTEETRQSTAAYQIPRVIDIWSDSFRAIVSNQISYLVERQLLLSPNAKMGIWEETGNSIARHIWDAAIGLLIYLQDAVIASKDSFTLPQASLLLRQSVGKALNILELGAGCGLAGIAISQLRPDCYIYLTDLEEAQDLLKKNIDRTNSVKSSSLQCSILEWGSETTSNIPNVKFDLILISDCTYNADYCSALVQTLAAVAKLSPDVRILVSMKRRHDAEAVFEYLMEKAGLEAVESTAIPMPHQDSDIDSQAPVVEIYLYQQQTRSLRPLGRATSRCPA